MGKIKNSPEYVQQTIQYGWNNTFVNFKSWMEGQQQKSKSLLFLPVRLVLSSYLEKFDFVSLGYYLFSVLDMWLIIVYLMKKL